MKIAYQVVGAGAIDIVLVPGWVSNIEVFGEDPACGRLLRMGARPGSAVALTGMNTEIDIRSASVCVDQRNPCNPYPPEFLH